MRVWEGSRLICTISRIPVKTRLFPISLRVTLFNTIEEDEAGMMVADLKVRIAKVSWEFQPGPDGPLAELKPVGPLITSVVKGNAQFEPLQPMEV